MWIKLENGAFHFLSTKYQRQIDARIQFYVIIFFSSISRRIFADSSIVSQLFLVNPVWMNALLTWGNTFVDRISYFISCYALGTGNTEEISRAKSVPLLSLQATTPSDSSFLNRNQTRPSPYDVRSGQTYWSLQWACPPQYRLFAISRLREFRFVLYR